MFPANFGNPWETSFVMFRVTGSFGNKCNSNYINSYYCTLVGTANAEYFGVDGGYLVNTNYFNNDEKDDYFQSGVSTTHTYYPNSKIWGQ